MKFSFLSSKKTTFLFFVLSLFVIVTLWGTELYTFAQNTLFNLPHLTFNKKGDYYTTGSGGIISMSSVEEPAISLGSWNLQGEEVTLKLYKADEASLLQYLVHDEDNNQTNTSLDISKFQYITEQKIKLFKGQENDARIPLPLSESGIWYLSLEGADTKSSAFIVRSKNGLIVQELKDDVVVWAQKFADLRKLTDGKVTVYDMNGSVKVLAESDLNSDGLATLKSGLNADVAILRSGDDIAIAPINLQFLNVNYSYQRFNYESKVKHFAFTDRPLYQPGGKVYYKAILRTDDDARYSVLGGLARVIIYKNWTKEDKIFEKLVPINANGAIDGEFILPENASTGDYNLYVAHASEDETSWGTGISVPFQVEYFRKPEYTIDTDSETLEAIKGDELNFLVTGEYFSGQPLAGQEIDYTIFSRDAYDSEYLRSSVNSEDSWYYGWGYGQSEVSKGSVALDEFGRGTVLVDSKNLAVSSKGVKIITLRANFLDGSGNPVESSQNILLYPGELSVYRTDYNYSGEINKEYVLDLEVNPHGSFSVSNLDVSVDIKRQWWDKDEKLNYRSKEENLPKITTKTNANGEIKILFTPKDSGSYTFTVNITDKRGNVVSKDFGAWIRGEGNNYYSYYRTGGGDLTVSSERPSYQPGEVARLFIDSEFPFRDVLLSFQRDRVDRYQVVSLNGKNTTIEVPIIDADMPNTFARVSSFISHDLSTSTAEIKVPAEKKKIDVTIKTDKAIYGPGQSAVVNVSTEDVYGNPVPAEVTLWSVDKAIYELASDQTNNIFSTFWSDRYFSAVEGHSLEGIRVDGLEGGGGCFLADTKILLSNGSEKLIQDIQVGDEVLTKENENDNLLTSGKVVSIHSTEVDGYLIINGTLKVTPNHIVRLNNQWQEIGNAAVGDSLLSTDGQDVSITSIEWLLGKNTVYNFEVETYHTYFADGFWVHNQKGDTRSIFKDTAYWNPSLHTDENGRAQVVVQLPDNLTTWVFAGIASTDATQVGQSTAEIKVAKDVVMRPVLTNILRTGDKINFAAMINNFTGFDEVFKAKLEATGMNILNPIIENISVLKNSLEKVVWNVEVGTDEMVSKISARAESATGKADEVIQEIPILQKGFFKKEVFVGYGATSFDVQLNEETLKEKTQIILSLSSTQVGNLPAAMKYLIDYPYGCIEQTTSRFVPVLLANENKALFADVIEGKNLDEMVQKGISRLETMQQGDGGWGWWSTNGGSDPFISAYVSEYLLIAKSQGHGVPNSMLERAKSFLSSEKEETLENKVFKQYGLQFFADSSSLKTVFSKDDLEKLSHDVIPYAVIVNYKNGVTDPQENGLQKLLSLSKAEGEGLYWEAGQWKRFSSIDTTTAMALRALLVADSKNEAVPKAVRYLSQNRKKEYWSHTYATVQAARALLDYSKLYNELDADYSFKVKVDDKVVVSGEVEGSNQLVQTINLSPEIFKDSGSTVTIEKEGEGQIYSTLVLNEFYTKTQPYSENSGLNITRTYVNEKGYEYGIGLGDLVTVELTVEGLHDDSGYVVIEDELPAGLIPVNENLKNEEKSRNNNYFETKEYTKNGVIIALSHVGRAAQKKYVYKARAVASGEFYAPPAKVEYMYAPEFNAMTQDEMVIITDEAGVIRERLLSSRAVQESDSNKLKLILALVFVAFVPVLLFFAKKYEIELREFVLRVKHKFKKQE